MDYVIYAQGTEAGRVSIAPEGLYYRISAQCREPGQGLWRLWGCFGTESRCLGVLAPGAGGLRLERRVSMHSWPVLPESFVLGREAEGFRPWRGSLAGQEIPDAMIRAESGGGFTLALFVPPEGSVPFAERMDQMREAELDGRECLVLEWPQEELNVEN